MILIPMTYNLSIEMSGSPTSREAGLGRGDLATEAVSVMPSLVSISIKVVIGSFLFQ